MSHIQTISQESLASVQEDGKIKEPWIHDFVKWVIEMENKIDNLDNCIDVKANVLQEKLTAIEKYLYSWENKTFCEYCDTEFKMWKRQKRACHPSMNL